MAVQARMKVYSITDSSYGKSVRLAAVYSSDPASPNYSFSQATPTANVEMVITNPAAFDQFIEGAEYDLLFSAVVESQEGTDA